MNGSANGKHCREGVVTFLDILGWKGIYNRNHNAINSLNNLISKIKSEAETKRGLITSDIAVRCISDTIVMHSFCAEAEIPKNINIHGQLCQSIIPESISAEIPVRGTITFGEFENMDNIFVGKAVDEAAAWYEQADWIGVHLTPSAEYVFEEIAGDGTDLWIQFEPPLKNRAKLITHCVNWANKWNTSDDKIKALKKKFRQLGPIVPEISGKFSNTLLFVEKAINNDQN